MLSLLWLYSSSVKSDFILVTVNTETGYKSLERFIGYIDCRDRGIKNQGLAAMFGGKAGFYCVDMEKLNNGD